MTPRRIGLWLSILATTILVPKWVMAEASRYTDSTPVYQSEGNDRTWFNVSCATESWTIVLSSDTIARSTFIQSTSSNTYGVCLSSGPANTACTSSTVGVELSPNSAYTDYSKNSWYCRTSAGTIAQRLKGVRTRDNHDYGNIGNRALQ